VALAAEEEAVTEKVDTTDEAVVDLGLFQGSTVVAKEMDWAEADAADRRLEHPDWADAAEAVLVAAIPQRRSSTSETARIRAPQERTWILPKGHCLLEVGKCSEQSILLAVSG